jgi:hypothetical protein
MPHPRLLKKLSTWASAITLALGMSVVAGAVVSASASAATQSTLYASPGGSGTACSLATPCALTEARAVVETLNSGMTGNITVYLMGGTYQLTSTFKLGPQDSGENGHDVDYEAYPGQVPVLSGAIKVTGWSLYNSSLNIYRAAVPAGTDSSQLFVNGARAVRARTASNPAGFTLSGSSFVTSSSAYLSYTNQSDIVIVDDNDWKEMRCPLSSITKTSSGGSSLNVNPTCFAGNNTSIPNVGFPFNGSGLPKFDAVSWIENAYQLLTTPGQFYLDTSADYLYYIPLSGQNMSTADVELPTQQELVDLSGTPGHLTPINDTASGITYSGTSWSHETGRTYGDYDNDVHATTNNGDSASYTFTGSGIEVLTEENSDEGNIGVYIDGKLNETVSADDPSQRLAQQAVISISGLSVGSHTIELVKESGTYMLLDALVVIPTAISPVHNITFSGITFEYTTWNTPTTTGYFDNQSGVLWDPSTDTPVKTPAAVQVHRGDDIDFIGDVIQHTGDTGIDLADGTQNSAVTGDYITDTSASGVDVGEADDYYQNLTALMTLDDTISENTITHVGMDYHDDVGVWAGYTRGMTLSNNDIGYSPYGGISVGWGWGWESPCSMQEAQGLTTCRHGTNYAGDNQILDNDIHNIMLYTFDNGAIYTNGGQGGGNGSLTSDISGNVGAEALNSDNMIYPDEGSSYWDITDNVIRFGGTDWIGMWTPTINNITVDDNYSDNSNKYDYGTDTSFTQATIVSDGAWPAAAQAIIAAAGPSEQYKPVTGLIDDDDLGISYTGADWIASELRGLGDLDDGIHSTTANGAYASYTFTGTGISVISEKNSDEGNMEVYIDGADKGSYSADSSTREAQQVIYSVSGLTPGSHTLKIVKDSGTYMLLDGLDVTRTINDNDAAVAYTGSWYDSADRGDGDYDNDVHATTANGDSVTVTFYGSAIKFLTEKYSDEGTIGVSLDGTSEGTVNADATTRSAQQVLYSVSGLTVGRHTLTLTKESGTYMLVDRFDVS